jgi:hypothetical protein
MDANTPDDGVEGDGAAGIAPPGDAPDLAPQPAGKGVYRDTIDFTPEKRAKASIEIPLI